MLRESLISLFQSRGGGLYALGYVVTFVVLEVLEIPELFGDLAGLFVGDGTLPGSVIALGVDFFVDIFRLGGRCTGCGWVCNLRSLIAIYRRAVRTGT